MPIAPVPLTESEIERLTAVCVRAIASGIPYYLAVAALETHLVNGLRALRTMKLLALVVLLAGCGSIELATPSLLEHDAGVSSILPSDGGTEAQGDRGLVRPSGDAAPSIDVTPASCSSAPAGCSSCTAASSAGPGYPDEATCRAVVACVVDGGVAGYDHPLQSCHNVAGGGAAWGGLACVHALLELDCPAAPL